MKSNKKFKYLSLQLHLISVLITIERCPSGLCRKNITKLNNN